MNENEEKKSKNDERFAVEKEFADTTSFNGIYFWANSKNNLQRIIWIILVLGMI